MITKKEWFKNAFLFSAGNFKVLSQHGSWGDGYKILGTIRENDHKYKLWLDDGDIVDSEDVELISRSALEMSEEELKVYRSLCEVIEVESGCKFYKETPDAFIYCLKIGVLPRTLK